MEARRSVAIWLFACAALVYGVLVVGGITRLTHSGLSIVEWQPLVGALPPLSDAAWTRLFEQYRATPEFRLVNFDLTLEGFKQIFWWEYAHRLMGRLVGLVFLLPLLWFIGQGAISRALAWRLAGIFALGGLQGALGWYMVASGLVDDPRVSPFRLTAHLALALLIIGAILWTAWGQAPARFNRHAVPWLATGIVGLVFVMAMSGGLVAGTRAGFAYNTFPLMGGALVPPDLMRLSPWYLNFVYNPTTVQFVHRMIAWTLMASVPALWWRVRRSAPAPQVRRASNWMLAALALQVTLGISTLLSVVALPLAAAHQAGAVLLYTACLWTARSLGWSAGESQLSGRQAQMVVSAPEPGNASAQGYSDNQA
ncbi:MAG TPA: COX15/CtaA family protein [Burkholderiaceae bacterium]